MIFNFLKTTFRSLRKNYIYTAINVIGLAIGLSGAIITYALFENEFTFDRLQKDTENIYRVNTHRIMDSEIQPWGVTAMPLGNEISGANSVIKSFTRYGQIRMLVKYEDIVNSENIYLGDSNFFEVFKFIPLRGSLSAFWNKNTAVVTEEFASKYFGSGDALGRTLSLVIGDEVKQEVVIGAVIERPYKNSSLQFTIMIPYDNVYELYGIDRQLWSYEVPTVTYLVLQESVVPATLDPALQALTRKNNEVREDWKVDDFYLSQFRNQKDDARTLYSAITWPGMPLSALYGSLFMNLVILLIACFNFTNTAIAYARKRLKEIGIRKTFGGIKKQVILQFMLENIIQCFAALLMAMFIADEWISWMNVQWPIELENDYFGNPALMIFLVLLLFFVSVIAGAYPSLYVSGFQPSRILKGDFKLSGTNLLTRTLLTFQFGFSIIAIFSGVVLFLNARFQTTLDWGYNRDSVIMVPLHEKGNIDKFRNSADELPGVSKTAGTVHNVGYSYMNTCIDIDGNPHDSQLMQIGDGYLSASGMKVVQGRDFSPGSEYDMKESVLVNQNFVESFRIRDPLSQVIKMDGKQYAIIGVIKDFKPYGLYIPIEPVILSLVPDEECTQLCIAGDQASMTALYSSLHNEWKKIFPMKPFEGYYQDQASRDASNTNLGILKQFGVLAIFALFLSIFGLYSMVSLNINKRTKEFGIRKVLGAPVGHIINLVNREFIIILFMASLIGCTMGYYFMEAFLGNIFIYHINIGPGIFILSVLIIFFTAIMTSGRKIYMAANANPAKSLRYE
ncbi:MAG TPA: FtsX-like permease family protein [Cyclobacteriaceae bacterium]|nr:FtsX-like permease family protein [Cyclobacteriaceae bacterium]